jgi:hypothetical protein
MNVKYRKEGHTLDQYQKKFGGKKQEILEICNLFLILILSLKNGSLWPHFRPLWRHSARGERGCQGRQRQLG